MPTLSDDEKNGLMLKHKGEIVLWENRLTETSRRLKDALEQRDDCMRALQLISEAVGGEFWTKPHAVWEQFRRWRDHHTNGNVVELRQQLEQSDETIAQLRAEVNRHVSRANGLQTALSKQREFEDPRDTRAKEIQAENLLKASEGAFARMADEAVDSAVQLVRAALADVFDNVTKLPVNKGDRSIRYYNKGVADGGKRVLAHVAHVLNVLGKKRTDG